jgi:hypothetical protein
MLSDPVATLTGPHARRACSKPIKEPIFPLWHRKSRGKGKPAGNRGVKDLPPGKTQNVKGGWSFPMAVPEPAPKPKVTTSDFNFVHNLDKASPNLL